VYSGGWQIIIPDLERSRDEVAHEVAEVEVDVVE
jgi:hypothetical protein